MNIKITKGGSGKVNSTKGGSGKLIEKKYIDLLPPNFISKVTLSGGTYSNGTYTRSSGGVTTFNGPNGKYIEVYQPNNGATLYSTYDPSFPEHPIIIYVSFDEGNTWIKENAGNVDAGTPPTSVIENALTFLFDPIFYKKEIQNERYKILLSGCSLDYVNGIYSQTVNPSLVNNRPAFTKDDDADMQIFDDGGGAWIIRDSNQRNGYTDLFIKNNFCGISIDCHPDQLDWSTIISGDAVGNETPPTITLYLNLTEGKADLDPVYLEELRSYQINGTIPTFPNIDVRQKIPGTAFNTRKAEFANNTYRYIKYNNNDDVEHLKGYGNLVYTSVVGGVSGAKGKNLQDLVAPLLKLRKNDGTSFINISQDFTFNTFVKLQRPIAHTSPTNYLVREKRGIFAGISGTDPNRDINIGYRSPYYNINGNNTYKLKFEPFSFVFSFGHGWTNQFGFGNFTLMTDYKYKFGEMYMLSITRQSGEYKIYINGELETTAMLKFNPCVRPAKDNYRPERQTLSARLNQTPLAPGFLKKNGLVYSTTATSWTPESVGFNYNFLFFGNSRRGGAQGDLRFNSFKRKRFLNNLDIGVINSYNIALSQTLILQMYNNFRYRYL